MPLTFDQIVTAVQRRVADHSLATDTIVGNLVNEAHSELIEENEWSRKKSEIVIATVAEETSGTFNLTNGASTTTITGGSLSSADEGKYIKFDSDNTFYVVNSFSTGQITLKDFNGTTIGYAGTTNATAAYVMWKRWYTLGTAIESIYAANYKKELTEMLIGELDAVDPQRSTVGDPDRYILGPRDSSDLVQIEFFPRPTGTIAVIFGVILGHSTLSGNNLPIVPGPVLVWEAAVLSCHFIYAMTRDRRYLDLVDKYEQKKIVAKELISNQDEKKFGLPHYIEPASSGRGLAGSDYELDRDIWHP